MFASILMRTIPTPARALAVLLGQSGRSDKAFPLMKNWVVTQPQVADARVELARLYQEYGDDKTAEQQLTEAVKVDLNNPRAWKALASIQEKSGHYAQAVANYQRSLQINRFQPELAQKLASLMPTNNGAAHHHSDLGFKSKFQRDAASESLWRECSTIRSYCTAADDSNDSFAEILSNNADKLGRLGSCRHLVNLCSKLVAR